MTSLDQLFRDLESDRFSAVVNVASNLKTFLRALEAQPEVAALAAAMQSAEVTAQVCERVLDRVGGEAASEHEHPLDAALAAYVWLLGKKDAAQARVAAARVLEEDRHCWWARKVAERVLSTIPRQPGAASPPSSAAVPSSTQDQVPE